jgi:hypothetical protein
MTPTTLFRNALMLLGLGLALLWTGCRKPPAFHETRLPHRPPPAATTPARSPSTDLSAEAQTTVTDYLQALQAQDFEAAYGLLAKRSQSFHTRADFTQQGKQGMPLYDLRTALVTVRGTHAQVTLSFQEEPGSHAFHLTREGTRWRVVYRGGAPGMPYPEVASVGHKGEAK